MTTPEITRRRLQGLDRFDPTDGPRQVDPVRRPQVDATRKVEGVGTPDRSYADRASPSGFTDFAGDGRSGREPDAFAQLDHAPDATGVPPRGDGEPDWSPPGATVGVTSTGAAEPAARRADAEIGAMQKHPRFGELSEARQNELIDGIRTHGSAEAYLRSLDNGQLLSLAEAPDGRRVLGALNAAMSDGGLSQSELAQVRRLHAASFTPRDGLTINGSARDRATALHALRRAMLNSPSFHASMMTLNDDATHPVTLNVGRYQPGVVLDQFNGGGEQTLDLADLEKLPESAPAEHPSATTQGQLLAHMMTEARQGALGDGYLPAHQTAIAAENQFRADIGQPGRRLIPPADAPNVRDAIFTELDNGYREYMKINAANIDRIERHEPSP